MSKLKVMSFAISIDGYGAGPNQNLENPLGKNGLTLHEWFFPTKTFQAMHGESKKGESGVDDDFAARGTQNIGAWILGRNMFSPTRGPWQDHNWRGWWGDEPPYHTPVYILTQYPRPSIEMQGGTTFHFVSDGIEAALKQAKESANGKDIRIGGGVATIRSYLQAGLLDELHLVVSPVILGEGENLLSGINLPSLGFEITEKVNSEKAMHIVLSRN